MSDRNQGGGAKKSSGADNAAAAENDDAYDLDALDIDRDFNVWESFRSSLVSNCTELCGDTSYVADGSKDRAFNSDAHEAMYADGNNSLTDEEGASPKKGAVGSPQNKRAAPQSKAPKSELTKDERDFIRKWTTRVRKEEVYSRYYRPVPREQREMKDLAEFLGVPKEGGGNDGSGGGKPNLGAKFRKTMILNKKPKGGADRASSDAARRRGEEVAATLFYPADDTPKSILLKRGPVLLRDAEGDKQSSAAGGEERELILVTRGFVVASTVSPEVLEESGHGSVRVDDGDGAGAPPPPSLKNTNSKGRAGSPSVMNVMGTMRTPKITAASRHLTALPGQLGNLPAQLQKKVIRRNFESCDVLSDVERVEDAALVTGLVPQTLRAPSSPRGGGRPPADRSFAVTVGGGGAGQRRKLVFSSGKEEQKAAWLEALEIAVVHARILAGRTGGNEPGWEHEILRTSLYSAAVLDDATMLRKALSMPRFEARLEELDKNGYTALHYATMRNHSRAMEMLLKAGANANTVNSDQRTPMYFAEQSEFEEAADLLETYGGTKSTALDEAGELFGQAAQAVKMSMYPGQAAAPPASASAERGTRGAQRARGGAGARGGTGTGRARGQQKQAAAARDADAKATGAAGAMSDAMNALRERGERLGVLDEKTEDLKEDAAEYRDLAKQLKEKAKKENAMFGF